MMGAGYGHVAPKTKWGRMITIVYALVGIPLTFLYLSNMGNFMAKCFRLFYQKVSMKPTTQRCYYDCKITILHRSNEVIIYCS